MFLLQLLKVNKKFGGLHVTNNVSIDIDTKEIHCLIGPNGAGKSTLFKLILGQHQVSDGDIIFDQEDITLLPSYERIHRGMSVKFQVPGLFYDLTVRHNIEITLQHHCKKSQLQERIDETLEQFKLVPYQHQKAGSLAHGHKQWLEIGMAVSLKPKLLLLDEPTAGMSMDETYQTGEMLKRLHAEGMGILAVEHDMGFVRQIANRVTVLHLGRVFAQGTVDEITQNEQVAAIYLGNSHG